MKPILSILTVFLFSIAFAKAQNPDYVKSIAQTGCDCMEAKDLENLTMSDFEMEIGMCLMESILMDMERFQKEFDLDLSDQKAMEGAGEKIGFQMASVCPNVMMQIAGSELEITSTSATNTITGTLESISGKDLAIITINSPDGSSNKLVWLEMFEGSNALAQKIGKTVSFDFVEKKIYSPVTQTYISRKVVTGMQ